MPSGELTETEVRPAPGDGLTMFRRGGVLPGTIQRVSTSGRCVWFVVDPPPGMEHRPDRPPWVHRALRQDDGTWREDYTKERIEMGVRRPYVPESNPVNVEAPRTLEQLRDAVERIEPWLLRTTWPPMSYMMIPSVLASADKLIVELSEWNHGDFLERSQVLGLKQRMEKLRAGFKRVR